MALDFEPGFPVRVTSGGSAIHPTAAETTRGLLALCYQKDGEVHRTYSLDRGASWATGQKFVDKTSASQPRARYNHRGGFAIVWNTSDEVYFEEVLEIVTVPDDLVSCRVSRSEDASSKGADVVLVNPRRKYDPEVPKTKWTGIFQPGTQFVLKAGYGGEVATRFSGFMDDVHIDDLSATVDFTARGHFKQLLDQSIGRDIFYSAEKCSKIVSELAIEAGIDADLVQVQDTGVRYSCEVDREKTYIELFEELAELCAYVLLEPDEGGLIFRAPTVSTTPAFSFEEEVNMFRREREWSDDEVHAKVRVYRKDIKKQDGTIKKAGFEVERIVDTPFFVPPKKIRWKKVGEAVTQAEASQIADAMKAEEEMKGSTMQIVAPLNSGLEVGDTVFIRRKSINQSGVYMVSELDDDMQLVEGGEAEAPAFASAITARRIPS